MASAIQMKKKAGFFSKLLGLDRASETVSDEVDVETLIRLKALCKQHTFVDVTLRDRGDRSYQSLIIDVDAQRDSLLIDELYMLDSDTEVMPGERVTIKSCERGLPVQFDSAVTGIEIFRDALSYRIALPHKVQANQRREFFRLDIDRDMGLQLRLQLAGGLRICDLLNLSATGLAMRVDKNISEQLQKNRLLNGVELTLPDKQMIRCDLDVKNYEYQTQPYRYTQIGGSFTHLSSQDRKKLEKFLVSMQREIKRKSGDL